MATSSERKSMRMLAVAFGAPTMAEACAALPRIAESGADCVELRLDFFQEPFDLASLLRLRGSLTVVATLRPTDQGGRSGLAAEERLQMLVQAAELGADYVDLEYDAATPAAVAGLQAAGARVIASRHDFSGMPRLADEWWPQLKSLGADVVKLVGTATAAVDCLEVFRALARADMPTIAIGMGAAGLPTRVLALRSDQCLLTYATLDGDVGTAPGQLSASELRQTYRASRLDGRTRVFGLLGPHAEAERLAEYNAWFAEDEVDGVAVPFFAEAGAARVVSAFRELPVSGWHIHGGDLQREVVGVLDGLSPKADAQGKVNAIVRRDGGALLGDWVESPREQYQLWLTTATV